MKIENTDLFQSIAQTITVKVGGFKERKTVALDRVNMAYDLIVCSQSSLYGFDRVETVG